MATYIKDSTGSNHAEILGEFTTDTVNKVLTWTGESEGGALPNKVLDTNRQFIIAEVRDINGTERTYGYGYYSEDVTDIVTRMEALRQDMITRYTSFNITCTHVRDASTADVYRGNEATGIALEQEDTGIIYTIPEVWAISDTQPFAPYTPEVSTNIVADSGCDNPAEWDLIGTASIVNSKLEITDGTNGAKPHLTEALVAGATYDLLIDCDVNSAGFYRFYVGDAISGSYLSGSGTDKTQSIECPEGATDITLQGVNGCVGTFDNFRCIRR